MIYSYLEYLRTPVTIVRHIISKLTYLPGCQNHNIPKSQVSFIPHLKYSFAIQT